MERTWKKTLAASIAAVVIVVALVLAGGRLTDHTAPADQGSSAMQQTDADRQQEQTLDSDAPDVVGQKQNGNREVTGSTTGRISIIQTLCLKGGLSRWNRAVQQ